MPNGWKDQKTFDDLIETRQIDQCLMNVSKSKRIRSVKDRGLAHNTHTENMLKQRGLALRTDHNKKRLK